MTMLNNFGDFDEDGINAELQRINEEYESDSPCEVVSRDTLMYVDWFLDDVKEFMVKDYLSENLKNSSLSDEMMNYFLCDDFFDAKLSKYYFIRKGVIWDSEVYFCFKKTLDNE